MDLIVQGRNFLLGYGPPFAAGIAILVVGIWLAGVVQRGVATTLERVGKVELTLARFLASLSRYLILVVVVLAALSQFGIQTASLIAVFGAAGLAVGLALQGTLSNVAAGVMLLAFRPYRVGERIDAERLLRVADVDENRVRGARRREQVERRIRRHVVAIARTVGHISHRRRAWRPTCCARIDRFAELLALPDDVIKRKYN